MPANAPSYVEQTKLFTINQEGVWNKIVIRKKTSNIVLIPQGATDNTWVDYWMDGHYSTLIRSDNDNYLELSVTLHVPKFTSDSWYMIWFSIFDEPLTI